MKKRGTVTRVVFAPGMERRTVGGVGGGDAPGLGGGAVTRVGRGRAPGMKQ